MIRPRNIALGVLVAAIAMSATSVPASAHDSLISSTPEPGERLESAPGEVSLRFSDDVLTVGSAIIVSDADGHDWVTGDVAINGDTVSVELDPGLPEAGYEIRWRVVSSDGHPISGLVPFTVGDGTPITRSAPGAGAGDERPDAVSPGSTGNTGSTENTADEATGQVTREFAGIPRVVVLGAGGAAVALALAALITFIRRRARAGEATRPEDELVPDTAHTLTPDSAATPHSRHDARGQHLL